MKTALVLAGGGVAGIAWELGVLRGISDVDSDLAATVLAADVVVGTSAGSSVSAQITSAVPLGELYAAQLSESSAELEVDVDLVELMQRFAAATAGVSEPGEVRRRIGALALASSTIDEATRRAAVAARLPVPSWPDRDLRIPAVDALTGEPIVFTRGSGVGLLDAVAASCAVPGVWPPVTIGGRRYVDGGVRSATNADLAVGCDRVLVITPGLADAPQPWGSLDDERALLAPAQVSVIYADPASVDAFGPNPLSPATRPAAAKAGRDLGRLAASAIAVLWA